MAPTNTSPTARTPRATIPSFYRLFFLYLDPLLCLSGIYLCFFDPATFLTNGVPSSLKHETATPSDGGLASHFIRSIGAYSIAIFVLQIWLGWGFRDASEGLNVRIWRILQFAILTIDISLLYSICFASATHLLDLRSWDSGDWTNNGILSLVAIIRSAFLLRIGM